MGSLWEFLVCVQPVVAEVEESEAERREGTLLECIRQSRRSPVQEVGKSIYTRTEVKESMGNCSTVQVSSAGLTK
jgi:hypothetical protein